MPELPEVETVRRFLEKALLYPIPKVIKTIKLYYEPIVKQPQPNKFVKFLVGQKFTEIDRYGKFLLLKLEHHSIISHLRMEGKYAFYTSEMKNQQIMSEPKFVQEADEEQELTIKTRSRTGSRIKGQKISKSQSMQDENSQEHSLSQSNSYSIGKHDHVEFLMTDGSSLVFSDVRKFGTMHLVDIGTQMDHKSLKKLGPEVNKPDFTVDYLEKACKNKSTTIKQILLKQEIVCGIGNIYADEILYAANIHPESRAQSLKKNRLEDIVEESKRIINKAIQNKGTTFRSFSSNNQEGNNQNFLCVYGKAGEKCQKCNTKISKIVVGGRGTHFCPICQKKS